MNPARFARFRRSQNDTADTALDAIGTPCSDRYSVTSFLTKVQPERKGALPAAIYPFQISKNPQYPVLFLPSNFSGCQPFSRFDSQIQPIRKMHIFLGRFCLIFHKHFCYESSNHYTIFADYSYKLTSYFLPLSGRVINSRAVSSRILNE